jgi:hypothetical protein
MTYKDVYREPYSEPLGNLVRLHSTVGNSDKVYELFVEQDQTLSVVGTHIFNVRYANGRRTTGALLGKKRKNIQPLSLAHARALMRTLANEKLARGYHYLGQCELCSQPATSQRNKPHLMLGPAEVWTNAIIDPPPTPKRTHVKQVVKPEATNQAKAAPAPIRKISFDDDDL